LEGGGGGGGISAHNLFTQCLPISKLFISAFGDFWCQFHQYFMRAFYANILLPKSHKAKLKLEKSCVRHFCKKKWHKMLMKLTTGVDFINILCKHFAPIFLCQKLQNCDLGLNIFWHQNIGKKTSVQC
jgi:hypothetical protein